MVTHMKTMETLLPVLVVAAVIGCGRREAERKPRLMLDSAPSGDNVTLVRPKESVRPDERVTDLTGLPTIMQYDLEAAQRTASKEVVYVKPGEPARPAEARP
jgi:hypothetical protein